MKKTFFKTLALVLSILMALHAIPATALEELANTNNSFSETENEQSAVWESDNTSTETKEEHIYEDTSLREANTKHFKLDDGSYIAAQYPYAVHIKDESGSWKNIDNTLSDSGSDFSTSNARVKFAKKTTGNETLFTLHDSNYKITMSLNGATKKINGIVTNNTDAENDTELQKLMNLEKLSSSILYPEILNGVDLEYIVDSLNIKENIIVKTTQDNYSYSFTLKLNNLAATLNDDGSISIFDLKDSEIIYVIPAPIVYDASGVFADDNSAHYALEDQGNGKYTLTVTADSEWMNADERTWPITIDPAIYVNLYDDMSDTFISSSSTSSSFGGYTYMDSGHGASGQEYITYWMPDILPSIPENAYIVSADLALHLRSYITSANVSELLLGVYPVTSSWTSSHTWTKYTNGTNGTMGALYECVRIIPEDATKYISFNITDIARQWIDETLTNYGVAIRQVGTDYAYARFDATNKQSNMPCLTINYHTQKGLESYWSYSSHNISNIGVGNINLATGELNLNIPTIPTLDALFGFSPTLIYNSSDYNKYNTNEYNPNVPYVYGSAGYGWRLNVNETVVEKTYTDKSGNSNAKYYIWTDGDGTEHAFYPDTNNSALYRDEDGLQMTLTVGSTYIDIKDQDHNTKRFLIRSESNVSKAGATLNIITDKFGNSLKIYNTNWGRVNGIAVAPAGQSDISYLSISYNSGYCVSAITNTSTGHKVSFEYSTTPTGATSTTGGGYLRKIIFSHTSGSATTNYSTIEFTYRSSGQLYIIKDTVTGKSVYYQYSSEKTTLAREKGGDTWGQTIGITYGNGTAAVRTSGKDDKYNNSDDILTHYTFDNKGRSISSYSTNVDKTIIYGATTGTYSEQAENKLKTSSVSGGSPVNYIVNSNFEMASNALSYWSKTANVSADISYDTFDIHASMSIKPSTTDKICQYVKLPNGTYTLSANITTLNCTDVNLYLKATPLSSGTTFSKEIPASENRIDSNISPNLTFEVNSDSGYITYCISIEAAGGTLVKSNAIVTIDDVMLEKGIGSSQNSVVRLGSFYPSSITSSGATDLSLTSAWTRSNTSTITIESSSLIQGNGAKIVGSLTKKQNLSQTISILPASFWENNTFVPTMTPANFYMFSGFANGSHQVSSGFFGFKLTVTCYASSEYDDESVYEFDFPCNKSVVETQFISGLITIPTGEFVKTIKIACIYDNNPGIAYFDNISLVPITDGSAAKYTYNNKGLIETVVSPVTSTYYEYDEDGNLSREASIDGISTEYEYNNNVLTSTKNLTIDLPLPIALVDVINENYERTYTQTTTYTYNEYGLLTQTLTYNENDKSKYVRTTTTYETTSGSKIFGKTLSTTDENSDTIQYIYDSSTGQLMAQKNPDGTSGLYYVYDSVGRLIEVTPLEAFSLGDFYPISNAEKVSYTYNEQKQLSKIITDTTVYEFKYDNFGNLLEVKAGNYILTTYTYNSNNGKLDSLTYGNGTVVTYFYDALDRIEKISYNDVVRYEYQYTSDGKLHSVTDALSNVGYLYNYDSENRLSGYVEYKLNDKTNTLGIKYIYNDKNQLSQIQTTQDYTLGNEKQTVYWFENYFYNDENDLLEEFYVSSDAGYVTNGPSDIGITFTYDIIERLSQKLFTIEGDTTFTNTVTLAYNDSGKKASSQISSYSTRIGSNTPTTYNYTYDANGNITQIVDGESKVTKYTYDDLNQLIREDNPYTNESYVFAYDNNGNRTSKKTYAYTTGTLGTATATQSYTYGDTSWGDRLTKYNNVNITYDTIGNPLSYNNGTAYTFTWSDGRRLATATKGGISYSFTYNDEGIRTSKIVGGVKHTYVLDGSRIVSEQFNNIFLSYSYDESGAPMAIHYRVSGSAEDVFYTYYLEKNLQGDVIALYNASGIKLVGYSYDAWGNCATTYYNGGGSTGAQYNPFRYRGYYYDTGLELYYLNSRYYDSRTGRFISPDDPAVINATPTSLTDKNLYAYCDNNPIMRTDNGGQFWDTVFDVVSLAFSVADVITNPSDPWAWAGLAGDAIDLIPFVSGVGEVTKAVGATMDIVDAIDDVHDAANIIDNTKDTANLIKKATTGSPNDIGKMGEMLAGIDPKAKTIIEINGRRRIPDAMTDTLLKEVKNVKYISNTQQLRDFAQYANDTGRALELWVRPTTKVAQTVRDAGWTIRHLW